MRTRMIAALVCAALLLTALVGCGSSASSADDEGVVATSSSLRVESVTFPNGRTVTCIVYSSDRKGGLSCDWAGAITPTRD